MPERIGRTRRVSLLSAFLTATVLLALWLGWEAVDAADSRRETAEAVLRDYARISLGSVANVVDDELDDLLDTAFDNVDGALRRFSDRLPDPREIGWELDDAARASGCGGCIGIRNPVLLFTADLATGGLRYETPGPEEGRAPTRDDVLRIAARVAAARPEVRGGDTEGLMALEPELAGSSASVVGFLLARDTLAHTRVAGFVVPREAVTELLAKWFDDTRLLPEPIGGGLPNDSLLNVTVRTADGLAIYSSPVDYPARLAVSDTLDGVGTGLIVDLAVRPDKASELIIGGLPSTRLPLLIALLFLTLGVGAAALVQSRRERRFQRLRDDFVSGVSHELRTPLAQIRMFAELQETGRLTTDDDRSRATRVIHREARRLSHLVENILQFSRLRYSRGPELPLEELDLAEALRDGVEAMEALIRERGMRLQVDLQRGLRMRGNRDALTRIVVNLLDNASKYGPSGQTVRLELDAKGGEARLTVEDEGPGVPPPDRERIWHPYRRLERDVIARRPGTGIGLAVVRDLAVTLGGSTRVLEAAGGGARFVVALPLVVEKSP
ncbi:HAMP domain-containing sensor histidine kinase [Gaopeijia maritima]|uniref:sensor histidine kinase n=1 Tax=Gaopeijia maritima TaxID=3119007 RepID=UPI003246B2F9